MHITDLYIRGYGIFQDCRVQEISPGLNIFLGHNEAGKSTCLAFIRDVLFGSPDGRSREKSYPALRGGRWGGSLGLASQEWSRLLVERGPGPKGGQLSVTSPKGEGLGPEALNRLLSGTTREVFKNVYAFSLSELQTLETLSTERIKDAIYSAGLGAGLSSLPQILKELENRREKLFKAKGQNQIINQLLARNETVRKELKQAQGDIQAYDQLSWELENLEQQRQDLKHTISSQQGRLYQLRSLLSRWEEWNDYQRLCQELQELPWIEVFPENGLQQYQSLVNRLQSLQEQQEDLEQELGELQSRLDWIKPEKAFLEQEQDLQALAENRAVFVQDQQQLPGLEQKLQARQEELQATLRQLGPDWNPEQIQALDTSLLIQEQLEGYADSLRELEEQQDRAARELQSREQELSRATSALKQTEKDLESWGPAQPELDLDLAVQLRRERDRFAQALEDLQARRQEQDQGQHELERILAEIGPDWKRQDLESLDTSLQVKERLEGYAWEFTTLEQQGQTLEQELRSKDTRRQELQLRLQGKEKELQELQNPTFASLQEIRQARQKLQTLQGLQSEAENCEVRMQALQDRIQDLQRQTANFQEPAQPGRVFPAAAAAGLLGCLVLIILAAAGLVSWNTAWAPAAILGLTGAGLGWLWQKEKRASASGNARMQTQRAELEQQIQQLQDKLQGLEQDHNRLQNKLKELKAELQPGREFDPAALEAELERSRDILHTQQKLQQELQELRRELQGLEQELQELQGQKVQKEQLRQRHQAAWEQELAALGLGSGLMPASALRILERAEAAKSELSHLLQAEARLKQLQAFVQSYAGQVAQLPQAKGLDSEQGKELLSAVDRYLDKAEQEQDRLRNRELAQQERDRKSAERSRLQQEHNTASQNLEQAKLSLQEKVSAWRHWLLQMGLPLDLSPQLAKEALDKAQKAQVLLAELADLEGQKQACLSRKQDFASRVHKLAHKLGRQEPASDKISSFLQGLLQELESSKEAQVRSQELLEQQRARQKTLEDIQDKIFKTRTEIQGLLQQAQVDNEHDFLSQGEILEQRQHLQAKLQDLERSLLRGTDQDSIEAVQEQFCSWNQSGLQEEISNLKQEIEEAEAQRQEISSRIGELNQEKQRLSSADDVSRLRQEEECLRQELHQA
ncbi:MAG: AAA family ATPase, partial [Desulfohalobiaceae bacterium]